MVHLDNSKWGHHWCAVHADPDRHQGICDPVLCHNSGLCIRGVILRDIFLAQAASQISAERAQYAPEGMTARCRLSVSALGTDHHTLQRVLQCAPDISEMGGLAAPDELSVLWQPRYVCMQMPSVLHANVSSKLCILLMEEPARCIRP